MNSEKILYWVALGALVLGVSHEYRDGKFPAAHRMVASAETTLCPVVARAERSLAMAKLILNPPAAATTEDVALSAANFNQDQAELIRDQAREQAEMVREQARIQAEVVRQQIQARTEMIRAQADMQRARFDQWKGFAQSQVRFSPTADRQMVLVCPKTGARISVKVDPPEVEVSDNF